MPDKGISDLSAITALADADLVEVMRSSEPVADRNKKADVSLFGGRIALTVASNDASDTVKARSDYVCTGVADDVDIQLAIDAMPAAGGMVMLSDGTFTLAAELTNTVNRLNLVGQGEGITILAGDGVIDGINLTASIRVAHLSFDTFAEAIKATKTAGAAIPYIILKEVEFLDCDFGLRGADTAGHVGVDFLTIDQCMFNPDNLSDCSNQIEWFQQITKRAEITYSKFINIESSSTDIRAILMGTNNYADQDEVKRVLIQGCLFDDIYGSSVAGDSDTQAILIRGKEISVDDNHFENIRSADDTDCEAVYFKTRHSSITNNVFVDAGRGEGAIALKGSLRGVTTSPQGYDNEVAYNQIFFTQATTTGIEIESEDANVHHNYIEGAEQVGINVAAVEGDDISITFNTIYGTTGAADVNRKGIMTACRGNYHTISHNTINGVDGGATQVPQGIRVQFSTAGGIGWKICENIISNLGGAATSTEKAGLLLKPSFAMTASRVCGNQFDACEYAISIASSVNMTELHMTGNKGTNIGAKMLTIGGGDEPTNSYVDANGATYQDNGASGASISPIPFEVQTYAQTINDAGITINAPDESIVNQRLRFMLMQDATGGRTVTWNAAFKEVTVIDGTAGLITTWEFLYNGSNWVEVAAIAGA